MRDGMVGADVVGHPRSVMEGDVRFAAHGGFSLVATGMEGPGARVVSKVLSGEVGLVVLGMGGPTSVVPKAVHFFPVIGASWPSNGPSKTALRPIDAAADMK